jgi:hypothetical protein
VDSDVTSTLSELERKLKELERELESVGRGEELEADPAHAGWTPPPDPAGERAPGADLRPPPPGTTPFTAVWHGGAGEGAIPAPPPISPYDGAPPVPVTPPAAPWPPAASAPPPPAYAPRSAFATPPPSPAPALHQQLDELLAFRERLVQATDDLVGELSRVLTDLGVGSPDPADTPLTGDVAVAAAPFADLGTLAAFEQALARVPGVTAVHTRALDAGRATIDVRLAGPVALGSALRATSPVPFAVTDVREGHLTLTLS